MKKIEQIITLESFRKIHQEKIRNKVNLEVQQAFEAIPKNWLKISQLKWLLFSSIGVVIFSLILFVVFVFVLEKTLIYGWLFLIIMALGIFAILLHFYAEKEINKHIKSTVNENRLYEEVFDSFKEIKFLKMSQKIMTKLISSKLKFQIPKKAILKIASPKIEIEYKSKYHISFQNTQWKWIESNGKTSTTYYEWLGGFEILVNDDKLLNNFEFTISQNQQLLNLFEKNKSVNLENKEFIKKFKTISNDEIKIRQILTPLAMENLLNYIKHLPLKKWFIEKEKNIIFLPYTTNYANVLILNFSSKSKNITTIANSITEDIIKDCYFMYSILAILKQMPLL